MGQHERLERIVTSGRSESVRSVLRDIFEEKTCRSGSGGSTVTLRRETFALIREMSGDERRHLRELIERHGRGEFLAYDALRALGPGILTEFLVSWLREDPDPRNAGFPVGEARMLLGFGPRDEIIEYLSGLLSFASDPRVRVAAIWALSGSGKSEVVPILKRALTSQWSMIRSAALDALMPLLGMTPAKAAALCIRSTNAAVWRGVLESLGLAGEDGAGVRWEEPPQWSSEAGRGDGDAAAGRRWTPEYAFDAVFSRDGRTLYSVEAGDCLYVWDFPAMRPAGFARSAGPFVSLAISSDGRHVAVGTDRRTAIVWRTSDMKRRHVLSGAIGRIGSLSFSVDGTLLACASDKGPVLVWDVETGQPVELISSPGFKGRRVCFSPCGRYIASTPFGKRLRAWDLASRAELWEPKSFEYEVRTLAFSPDGSLLATGHQDGLRLWDAASGLEATLLEGGARNVCGAAFAPDGRLLAASFGNGKLVVWETGSGRSIRIMRELHAGRCVLFSPDSRWLVSSCGVSDLAAAGEGPS